ncbi:hypothetical protein [Knoellia sp. Soil729]|uniref:hypothetical protein n=1 Tax=Knoellia sp. Soil729 TaxID=1736394 RepID=UPI0006F5B4D4|nr:hypothetical protein [Knoellia sp. Soil729]KRE43356.1 hypothetical protein ASG74_00430 [Knoellia sp. Soil729]
MSDTDHVVAAAAAQLYAVPLAEFVASRKVLAASAKADGDAAAAKEILALRKPTVTAWAMNLASRADPGVIRDLVGLGARMRAAQARLDASVLTSVRGERDATLAAYVEHVAQVATTAGAALSGSGRDEVRASAIAALADESASHALASGQLTRALSYSGFGEVDLSGAVGITSSGSIMSVLRGGKPDADVEAASERESDEEDEEEDDEDELTEEELAAAVAAAKAAKAAARARRAAEAEVTAAEAEMKVAQGRLEEAEDAARTARKAVVAAQKRLDAARTHRSGLG